MVEVVHTVPHYLVDCNEISGQSMPILKAIVVITKAMQIVRTLYPTVCQQGLGI